MLKILTLNELTLIPDELEPVYDLCARFLRLLYSFGLLPYGRLYISSHLAPCNPIFSALCIL